MSSGRLKFFLGLLVVALMAAPAVLRAAEGPPRWVLVRMGSRPVQDDPNQLAVQVGRLLGSVSDGEPVVLIWGILGLMGILVAGLLVKRMEGIWEFGGVKRVEWGLYRSRSGRAPPVG